MKKIKQFFKKVKVFFVAFRHSLKSTKSEDLILVCLDNPEVLKALRESSGYSVEEVAKKLNISAEKIMSTEEGKTLFTLAQIKKLADIYKRPLAAFFSSSIPELPEVHIYFDTKEELDAKKED